MIRMRGNAVLMLMKMKSRICYKNRDDDSYDNDNFS